MAPVVRHYEHPAHPRSPKWPGVERAHLVKQPACQGCGSKHDLNVHHIVPFHEDPSKELDESNLVTVCRWCHFVVCHLNNWATSFAGCLKYLAAHLKLLTAARKAAKDGLAPKQ